MQPRNQAVRKRKQAGGPALRPDRTSRPLLSVRSALVLTVSELAALGGAVLLYAAHRPVALRAWSRVPLVSVRTRRARRRLIGARRYDAYTLVPYLSAGISGAGEAPERRASRSRNGRCHSHPSGGLRARYGHVARCGIPTSRRAELADDLLSLVRGRAAVPRQRGHHSAPGAQAMRPWPS